MAGDIHTRKSIRGGYIYTLAGGTTSWCSLLHWFLKDHFELVSARSLGNMARDIHTRKGRGYIYTLEGGAISWSL